MPVFSIHITHGSKGDARQLFIICSRSGAAHERFPSLNRCGQGWRTTRFDAAAIPVSARPPPVRLAPRPRGARSGRNLVLPHRFWWTFRHHQDRPPADHPEGR
jgi:hypothetical protein